MAALFYGFITIGGQYFTNVGFSLYEISLLLMFVPLPLLPLLIAKPQYRIKRETLGFYTVFGLIGAALQITQFGGIVLGVPVAVVALLLYTQPLWTIILGKVLLNEKISLRKTTAAGLALLGVFCLLQPAGQDNSLDGYGLASAILAGLFLSLWVIWGRKSGLRREHFITSSFGYASFSSAWLLLLYPIVLQFWGDDHFLRLDFGKYFNHIYAVAAFAVFAGVFPACLAFAGMRTVDASSAGVLLLFEPVSAAILAFFIFGQSLTANIWLGGCLILSANYILLRKTTRTNNE